MKSIVNRHFLSASRLIITGFLFAILIGSLLLMLPFATKDGNGASFFDALFTSTSAVCVTGLVVRDTVTYWSVFGKAVILMLIQIGGMGVVTIAVAVTLVSGKKISLMQRSTMQEAISAPKVSGIVRLTGFILRTTAIFELCGAFLISIRFIPEFGPVKGFCYSVFHSVSAFCNAGFDLMGEKEPFSSLTSYADIPLINIVIMLLIIVGGIGFLSWDDIRNNKLKFGKYRMQTKVILITSAVLTFIPALYFFFYEFSGMEIKSRILNSLFQAVTPRTAGFNTFDLTKLTEGGQFLIIMLMLIGGSPGSTAGGMKTTTIAVLFLTALAVFRKRRYTEAFGRSIAYETVRSAATIFMMYIMMFTIGGIAISCIEHIPVIQALFETASAIGTVGLTLGITPSLCLVSRLILISLMFFGRVGGLTLIFATISGKKHIYKLPDENITVG